MPHDLPLRYIKSVPSGRSDDVEMPLVIVMHGRGADANDLAGLAPEIDGGYRFLFPNAPRPWEAAPGMMYGFTWFDGWPPAGTSFADSRRVMLEFIDAALERYPTPPGKLVIAGFSQGALMALDVGFRTPQAVAGIVAMSGAIHEKEIDKLRQANVLLVHGTYDEVIPVNAARRTRMVLEDHGIHPEYHEFPMGHQVSMESVAVVREFIRKCVD
jgi:phospholipase/carboxylesterase